MSMSINQMFNHLVAFDKRKKTKHVLYLETLTNVSEKDIK